MDELSDRKYRPEVRCPLEPTCGAFQKLKGPCEMDLVAFPMDQQMCYLTFESFNYNTDEVRMRWAAHNPISLTTEKIELPDFSLVNWTGSHVEAVRHH